MRNKVYFVLVDEVNVQNPGGICAPLIHPSASDLQRLTQDRRAEVVCAKFRMLGITAPQTCSAVKTHIFHPRTAPFCLCIDVSGHRYSIQQSGECWGICTPMCSQVFC